MFEETYDTSLQPEASGGEGGEELAKAVLDTIENIPTQYAPLYSTELSIKEKIETISKEIYGAKGVVYSPEAEKAIERIESIGYGKTPVCMAKTQYSLSDDQTLLGRPEDFTLTVRDVWLSAGAGYLVVLTGAIVTMPGLPPHPAALDIDIDPDGTIHGLF